MLLNRHRQSETKRERSEMKANRFLLIIYFVTLGTLIQLSGMSYWQGIKSYFGPSLAATQEQIKNFKALLTHDNFAWAFTLFKKSYPQANVDQKNEYIKIITDKSKDIAKRISYQQDNFIKLFLKPSFNVEPHLYNSIYKMIFSEYFEEPLTHDFQEIYLKNINKILTPSFLSVLWFLIGISKDNSQEANQEILKLYFNNLNILEGLTSFDFEYQIRRSAIYSLYKEIFKSIGQEVFDEYLIKHIDSIIKKNSNGFINLFNDLHNFNIAEKKAITDAIANNLMLFNHNPQVAVLFLNYNIPWQAFPVNRIISTAVANIKMLNPSLAETLLIKSQSHQLAQAIISEYSNFPEYLVLFAKNILENDAGNSPTILHLQTNYATIFSSFLYKQFIENPELKDLFRAFLAKERKLNKEGYYTFVHGQQRRFYFPEWLYTHLWGLRKHQSVTNFLFAHVKDLIETPETQFEEDITQKTIHLAGTIKESDSTQIDIERRKKVLFMNYVFFANTQNLGSNSADYILKNKNSPAGREIEISVQEPFTLLGYDWIYKKHQKEIEQLAKDYENISPFGNILLIAIPKDKIYKYAYLCRSGGLQQPLAKKDGTQITDIRIAMETLLKHPETLQDSDRIEFCLIMTQQKGGLDPSTGIQIYPLLSGDPEKLKALQAREKILLDKITADVKEAEKQQAIQRAAKIAGHVVESAEAK
jgi:hypothetical protein